MRPALTSLMLIVFGSAVNAQFSILPQAGFENSRSNIWYNNQNAFSPLGSQPSFHAGIRADYLFKQLHGPFLGISTDRSITSFNFSDPETGMNTYTASAGDLRLRLEAGYKL